MKYAAQSLLTVALLAPAVVSGATPPLVDAPWLESRLDDPAIRVVSLVSTREHHQAGHIPGAVFLDWRTEIIDPVAPERYNRVSKERLEELLSTVGVDADTTVVLYDNLDNRLAVRMFWMLRYYGHQPVCVLNGGEQAWRRAGGPVTASDAAIAKTNYQVRQVNESFCTGLDAIQQRLDSETIALIDGRPTTQFTGQAPGKVYHTGTEHRRQGRLPGAVNIPWKSNLGPDGSFKSPEELRAMYESRGVTRDKDVVTYCNEGLHAAMPWFVLTELLGYEKVAVYDDSLAEWANLDSTPLEVEAGP